MGLGHKARGAQGNAILPSEPNPTPTPNTTLTFAAFFINTALIFFFSNVCFTCKKIQTSDLLKSGSSDSSHPC